MSTDGLFCRNYTFFVTHLQFVGTCLLRIEAKIQSVTGSSCNQMVMTVYMGAQAKRKFLAAPEIDLYIYGNMVVISCCFMSGIFGGICRTARRMASTNVAGMYSMAFVTVPDMDVGRKLAHGIVKQRLAACVNIIPSVTSVYEWEGKVNEDPELLLMIKTSTDKVADLSQYVRENHPYDCAEVISSQIDDGNEPYLKWIGETMSAPKVAATSQDDTVSAEKKQKLDE